MGKTETIPIILTLIFNADDPWQELMAWLAEQRSINAALGGDDDLLIGLIINQIIQLGLPIRP